MSANKKFLKMGEKVIGIINITHSLSKTVSVPYILGVFCFKSVLFTETEKQKHKVPIAELQISVSTQIPVTT